MFGMCIPCIKNSENIAGDDFVTLTLNKWLQMIPSWGIMFHKHILFDVWNSWIF